MVLQTEHYKITVIRLLLFTNCLEYFDLINSYNLKLDSQLYHSSFCLIRYFRVTEYLYKRAIHLVHNNNH